MTTMMTTQAERFRCLETHCINCLTTRTVLPYPSLCYPFLLAKSLSYTALMHLSCDKIKSHNVHRLALMSIRSRIYPVLRDHFVRRSWETNRDHGYLLSILGKKTVRREVMHEIARTRSSKGALTLWSDVRSFQVSSTKWTLKMLDFGYLPCTRNATLKESNYSPDHERKPI